MEGVRVLRLTVSDAELDGAVSGDYDGGMLGTGMFARGLVDCEGSAGEVSSAISCECWAVVW